MTQEGLTLWMHLMSAFVGPKLLRIKGIVNLSENPVVIHAVRYLFHDPVALADWPSDDHDTRIVFITRGIDRRELESTFAACTLLSKRAQAGSDHERYTQFAGIFQTFRRAVRFGA